MGGEKFFLGLSWIVLFVFWVWFLVLVVFWVGFVFGLVHFLCCGNALSLLLKVTFHVVVRCG